MSRKQFIPNIPGAIDRCMGEISVNGVRLFVRILLEHDRIDFGVVQCFDRWANSCDFSAKIPKSERQWDHILDRLATQLKKGNYSLELGQRVWL
jgi:hypothetical protein